MGKAGRLIFLGAVLGLVAGCSAGAERWAVDGVPAGSRLQVDEPIPVSSYSGRAHVQAGRSVDPRQLNRFEPHCRFHIDGQARAIERIEPGLFEVTGYRTGLRVTDAGDEPALQLASARRGGAYISYVRHKTRLSLHSSGQPEVREMVCAYDATRRAPDLRFEQMRSTLDGLATLER